MVALNEEPSVSCRSPPRKFHPYELALKELTSLTDEHAECPICLETISHAHIVPGCLHRFCGYCIKEALRKCNNECPECREAIPTKRHLRKDAKFDTFIEIVVKVKKFIQDEIGTAEVALNITPSPKSSKLVTQPQKSTNQSRRDDEIEQEGEEPKIKSKARSATPREVRNFKRSIDKKSVTPEKERCQGRNRNVSAVTAQHINISKSRGGKSDGNDESGTEHQQECSDFRDIRSMDRIIGSCDDDENCTTFIGTKRNANAKSTSVISDVSMVSNPNLESSALERTMNDNKINWKLPPSLIACGDDVGVITASAESSVLEWKTSIENNNWEQPPSHGGADVCAMSNIDDTSRAENLKIHNGRSKIIAEGKVSPSSYSEFAEAAKEDDSRQFTNAIELDVDKSSGDVLDHQRWNRQNGFQFVDSTLNVFNDGSSNTCPTVASIQRKGSSEGNNSYGMSMELEEDKNRPGSANVGEELETEFDVKEMAAYKSNYFLKKLALEDIKDVDKTCFQVRFLEMKDKRRLEHCQEEEEEKAKLKNKKRRRIITFDERVEALKEIKRKFGHCGVTSETTEDASLKEWASRLRTAFRKHQEGLPNDRGLTAEKIQRLTNLGFSWYSPDHNNKTFDEWFKELEMFILKFGHCDVSSLSTHNLLLYEPLGNWCKTLREAYQCFQQSGGQTSISSKVMINNSRIRRLKKIGFQWVDSLPKPSLAAPREDKCMDEMNVDKNCDVNEMKFEAPKSFDERLGQLKLYKRIHGHCDVRLSDDTQSLWRWCHSMRKSYIYHKKGRTNDSCLDVEMIHRLEAEGFQWSSTSIPDHHDASPSLPTAQIVSPTAFATNNDIINVPLDRSLDNNIPHPSQQQRTRPTPVRFHERLEQLRTYKRVVGHCDVRSTGHHASLGKWCTKIRAAYRRFVRGLPNDRGLTSEKIKRLEDIGFKWATASQRPISCCDQATQNEVKTSHKESEIKSKSAPKSNTVGEQIVEDPLKQPGLVNNMNNDDSSNINFVMDIERDSRNVSQKSFLPSEVPTTSAINCITPLISLPPPGNKTTCAPSYSTGEIGFQSQPSNVAIANTASSLERSQKPKTVHTQAILPALSTDDANKLQPSHEMNNMSNLLMTQFMSSLSYPTTVARGLGTTRNAEISNYADIPWQTSISSPNILKYLRNSSSDNGVSRNYDESTFNIPIQQPAGNTNLSFPQMSAISNQQFENQSSRYIPQYGISYPLRSPDNTAATITTPYFGNLKNLEIEFDRRIQELHEFKTRFGHCEVPTMAGANAVLGQWCNDVRYLYEKYQPTYQLFSNNQIRRLQDIGFDIAAPNEAQLMIATATSATATMGLANFAANPFNVRVDELVRFKASHGHCRVGSESDLGQWCSDVRYYIKHYQSKYNMISDRQIKRLKDIGFLFEDGSLISDNEKSKATNMQSKQLEVPSTPDFFNERLLELKKFKERYGHCRVGADGSSALERWCESLRQSFKDIQHGDAKSTPDSNRRICMLEELGFQWTTEKTSNQSIAFEDRVKELRTFRKVTGHCDVSKYGDNKFLEEWCGSMRRAYTRFQEGTGPQGDIKKRIQILEEVGFEWDL